MAASYDALVTIAADAGFQGRVKYALLVAAVAAISESTATANHQARISLARVILADGLNIPKVAMLLLTHATLIAEANSATTPDFAIPDADLQTAVTAYFNGMAGVTT